MEFDPPLATATMIRRYKRFLADVRLPNGSMETMHCANTGAMLACVYPDLPVYYSISDNPKRKLRASLELVTSPDDHLICVNTAQANRLVKEALERRAIKALNTGEFRSEIQIPDESGRFDFGNEDTFIEVKMVTYLHEGIGLFPDAKSTRARKHVKALQRCVARGQRGVLLFCVPHTGIEQVAIAETIDPDYSAAVAEAKAAGVEILAYRCDVSPSNLTLTRSIPFLDST